MHGAEQDQGKRQIAAVLVGRRVGADGAGSRGVLDFPFADLTDRLPHQIVHLRLCPCSSALGTRRADAGLPQSGQLSRRLLRQPVGRRTRGTADVVVVCALGAALSLALRIDGDDLLADIIAAEQPEQRRWSGLQTEMFVFPSQELS